MWEAVPEAKIDPSDMIHSFASATIYRGMVADVSALASNFAHKPDNKIMCDDEQEALDKDRKKVLKTPAAKQCPFCAEPIYAAHLIPLPQHRA